jgi:hypothetical protein
MKLLYLVKRPLTARDAERFGVQSALERGHDVSVFDLSRVIHPNLPNEASWDHAHSRLSIEAFSDWDGFDRRQQAIEQSDLVLLLIQSYGLSRLVLPVLRRVATARVPYLILAAPAYTESLRFEDLPPAHKLGEIWSRLKLIDPLNSLIARLSPKWLGMPTARFAVVNGLASITSSNLIDEKTQLIPAHTHDYDLYLRLARENPNQQNYAAFIDQFVPFHTDIREVRVANRIDPDRYYTSLRRLFDHIEGTLGLEIVVAAHPRANYADRPELLGDRKIVYGQTPQLIAQSRLVLSHASTAVGFAVMFRRPVMVIVTRDYYGFTPGLSMAFDQLAENLGTALHFIDDADPPSLEHVMNVNSERYDRYINRYVRHPSASDKSLWNIIFDTLERDLSVRA